MIHQKISHYFFSINFYINILEQLLNNEQINKNIFETYNDCVKMK